ncbi:hippocampus abundant transcript 1 protein-like [Rhopilema esculentum]|uniref:hippocampus abundant transcript 1 protein-like n=1 Tax=Rhopilema esculentum TaxID=499914 RepID=UPI0031D32CC1|eukprot:gene4682-20967_t
MIKISSGKKKIKRILALPGAAATGRNWRRKEDNRDGSSEGTGKPSVYHATVIIFLEFFAWGLLTSPSITVLGETFGEHTFLMNGLIQGVKGLLSFLSAPLIGALSDVWGRKSFLLVTVFFTCLPIPILRFNPWWFFACVSISGAFAVTFSVVFAYVADCTDESERSQAYGLISATFAASLITSPALGAYLEKYYHDGFVIALATAIALLDLLFILLAVPESLPERMRPVSWGAPISWEQADPFNSLRKVGHDTVILLLSVTVFLSYLPEAGQYSCIFLYLKQVIGFDSEDVATYIAVVGLLSVIVQTLVLGILIKTLGLKNCILLALSFQTMQLLWYGFGTQTWMMWAAGSLAAMSSLAYPAISAMVSCNADPDQQGVVQGIVTGIRGLCNGIGPALYGLIFYLFHVDLSDKKSTQLRSNSTLLRGFDSNITTTIPGPPFVFGSCLALLAVLVAFFIPDGNGMPKKNSVGSPGKARQRSRTSLSEYESGTDTQLSNQENVCLLSDSNKPG